MKLYSILLLAPLESVVSFPSTSFPSHNTQRTGATRRYAELFTTGFMAPASFGTRKVTTTTGVVEKFLDAWNGNDIDTAMRYVDEDVEFVDTNFYKPFSSKTELERIFRLGQQQDEGSPNKNDSQIFVDEIVKDDATANVGILFHTGSDTKQKRGTAFFAVNETTDLIARAYFFKENSKSGEASLKILKTASDIIDTFSPGNSEQGTITVTIEKVSAEVDTNSEKPGFQWPFSPRQSSLPASSLTLPEQYFKAWSERDVDRACSLFSDDIEYDDTAFPAPFKGKEALEKHLNLCAGLFPPSATFVVDELVNGNGGNRAVVRWHVENDGKQLPFTRGCSYYEIEKGKIAKGVDFLEPAVVKPGGLTLASQSVKTNLSKEPVRLIPIAVWVTYMYVVFFSDWFYGLPATAMEQRTWEEVLNLSLNFFLVSPLLNLPFSPVVHPMLEGVFNLLLSWAAMFAGFLSDDRKDKPNLLPMLPAVAGMQFLTSAFLLPYLALRSNESSDQVFQDDLPIQAKLAESKILSPLLAFVGTGSIFWGAFARAEDFGGWNERLSSFADLLSIDRVGSSFLVDLAIFALFQGWLVDDDLKRRGMPLDSNLATVAKYVPFFGMAAYLLVRAPLPEREEEAI